jgi:hypothetical protein
MKMTSKKKNLKIPNIKKKKKRQKENFTTEVILIKYDLDFVKKSIIIYIYTTSIVLVVFVVMNNLK